jgi:antitoxin HicB
MSPNKDLEYYMNLQFPIEIIKIPDSKGGGFMACIPQLGRMTLVGDGETLLDAIQDLEEAKRRLFQRYLDNRIPIPEPEGDEEHSGRFVARLPKYLHRELSLTAKRNKVSLNSFVATLLSGALKEHKFISVIDKFETEIRLLRDHVCELKYRMPFNMIVLRNNVSSDDIDDPKAA